MDSFSLWVKTWNLGSCVSPGGQPPGRDHYAALGGKEGGRRVKHVAVGVRLVRGRACAFLGLLDFQSLDVLLHGRER